MFPFPDRDRVKPGSLAAGFRYDRVPARCPGLVPPVPPAAGIMHNASCIYAFLQAFRFFLLFYAKTRINDIYNTRIHVIN